MEINNNIWQTKDTFTIGGATFGKSYSIDEMFSKGKLILNTDFDKSIYMWSREPIIYNNYRKRNGEIVVGGTNVDESNYVVLATDSKCQFPVGFPNSYDKTPLIYAMRPNQTQLKRPRLGNAITIFDYKTVVYCIYVIASNNEETDKISRFTLKEYYETKYKDYPYIRAVSASSFCGVNNNRTNNKRIAVSTFTNFKYSDIHDDSITTYLSSPLSWTTTEASILDSQMLLFAALQDGNQITARWEFIEDNNYATNDFIIIGDPKTYKLTKGSVHNQFYYITFNLTYEQIIKEALKWGFIVTDNENSAKYGDITTDPNIYIPTISPSGKVTDEYTHGEDNQKQPQLNWKNPWEDSGFDPTDPNNYTNNINLIKPGLTTTGIFNRTFALTATEVNNLADYLWNADETIFTEVVKGLALMGGNPIDAMIDLRLYPFDCAEKAGGGNAETIVVGRTDTNVNALKINNYNAVLDLGSCTFHRKFGNFLDYEPFTTASLYIPYVGIVPISTADFMGQTIKCKMVVDITTGSCTAIVFANDIPIIYKNGNIGVEIPMTGTNSAAYASRIAGGLTSGASDIALGAASKSVGQVVSGVGTITDSALSVNNTMYNTAGSSSPACGLWQPQNCYFIIQRPVPIVPENYGHTVGYACNYQAKISDCSGYTQTYNVDVSNINAPESEKNAIAEILNTGFFA